MGVEDTQVSLDGPTAAGPAARLPAGCRVRSSRSLVIAAARTSRAVVYRTGTAPDCGSFRCLRSTAVSGLPQRRYPTSLRVSEHVGRVFRSHAGRFWPNTGELSIETHGIRAGTSGLRPDAVLGAFDWKLRHFALDDPGIGPQPPGGKDDVPRVEHLIEHLLVQGP